MIPYSRPKLSYFFHLYLDAEKGRPCLPKYWQQKYIFLTLKSALLLLLENHTLHKGTLLYSPQKKNRLPFFRRSVASGNLRPEPPQKPQLSTGCSPFISGIKGVCKVCWVIAISLIIFHSSVVRASFHYLCDRMSEKTWRVT